MPGNRAPKARSPSPEREPQKARSPSPEIEPQKAHEPGPDKYGEQAVVLTYFFFERFVVLSDILVPVERIQCRVGFTIARVIAQENLLVDV